MADKILLGMGVTGPVLTYEQLPQGAAVQAALVEATYEFDVPNEALTATVQRELTLSEAVQEVFAAATRLAAKG